jgi:biopolymer transport protein ExbD
MLLKTSPDELPALNLTPMIDVVFLLIIFFMVGTRFTEMERHIPVQVPQVSDNGTLTPAPAKRTINVYRDGRVSLDRRFLELHELQNELAAARSQYDALGVIVRGDADATFQHVAAVLNACRQAGISDMGISVRLAQQTATSTEVR